MAKAAPSPSALKASADKQAADDKARLERESLMDCQLKVARARRLEKLAKEDRAVAALVDENKALKARIAELEAAAK